MKVLDWEDGNRYLLFNEISEYLSYVLHLITECSIPFRASHELCEPPISTECKACFRVINKQTFPHLR